MQVTGVRKVGNAGVVVRTTTQAHADRLKEMAPPSLKVTTPEQRRPLVAVRNLQGDPAFEEVKKGVYEQNLAESGTWTWQEVDSAMKPAFKKSRLQGGRTTVVFSCTPKMREELIRRGQLYMGWEVINVADYIDATCCRKCQLYGHPERYCRQQEFTCGKCGQLGHKQEECTSAVTCCATCKRFSRPEAANHQTASRDCPARKSAEVRAVSMTNYGY